MSNQSFIPPGPGTRKLKGQPGCRVFLLRHGETANAHEVCMNGHFDVDLSNAGVEQVRDIGRVLKDHPITAVYSSDLQRTLKGAQIIAEYHSLKPIPFAELRELSFGHWEGLSIQELNTRFPGELDKRIQNTSTFQADGGETFRQLHDRVIPKYEEIIHRHPEETIVIMSHGGVNRTVLAHLLGFPADNLFRIAQEYAAVNILQYYESHVVVELMNGTPGQIR